MNNRAKPIVAVTQGDTNGIGYEMILKTFSDDAILDLLTPVVYGSPKVAAYHRKAIDIPANFTIISQCQDVHAGRFNLLTTTADEVKVDLGEPASAAGRAAFVAMEKATADVRDGSASALVLSPVLNSTMKEAAGRDVSATDYLETVFGLKGETLLLHVRGDIRIAELAAEEPINRIAGLLNKDNLKRKIGLLRHTLCRDFNIDSPRIAVMALNAGDVNGEYFGSEEEEIIRPVCEQLSEEGKGVYGPLAPAEVYPSLSEGHYDAVLTLCPGQAETAISLLTDHEGYDFIAGLPIVAVRVAHGVDYSAAGKNRCDASSLRESLYGAIDISRNRQRYDEAHSNPLPKLYHERRDEAERGRYGVRTGQEPARPASPARVADQDAAEEQ